MAHSDQPTSNLQADYMQVWAIIKYAISGILRAGNTANASDSGVPSPLAYRLRQLGNIPGSPASAW